MNQAVSGIIAVTNSTNFNGVQGGFRAHLGLPNLTNISGEVKMNKVKSNRICITENCIRKPRIRGMCKPCHEHWKLTSGEYVDRIALHKEKLAWIENAVANPPNEGCLIWPYGIKQDGYGYFALDGKQWPAHRYVLVKATGENPIDMDACHSPIICHNRACCSLNHLRWDSAKGNAEDKAIDGTLSIGQERYNTDLTNEMARAIYLDPRGPKEVSNDYPASPSVISCIQEDRSWTSVTKGLVKPVRKKRMLSDDQARSIFLDTDSNKVIALKHSIDQSMVRFIKNREIYTDCTGDI